jgi:acyl-CoA reductase-like NAD-dependent aldehyde dehydrogenase
MHELDPGSPYSGWKRSGLGVEGGIEQAEEFTRAKSVWINVDTAAPEL